MIFCLVWVLGILGCVVENILFNLRAGKGWRDSVDQSLMSAHGDRFRTALLLNLMVMALCVPHVECSTWLLQTQYRHVIFYNYQDDAK